MINYPYKHNVIDIFIRPIKCGMIYAKEDTNDLKNDLSNMLKSLYLKISIYEILPFILSEKFTKRFICIVIKR